ncbi:MAG: hypothetical protein AB4080_19005 [Trichodesmium sp.]
MQTNIGLIALIVFTGINVTSEVTASISRPEKLQSEQQILSEIIAQGKKKIMPGEGRRRESEKDNKSEQSMTSSPSHPVMGYA